MKFILLILLISFATCYPKKPSCDFPSDIACNDGTTCIPIDWICDNVPDCPTGEDEARCRYLFNCPVDTFMCRYELECIPKEQKCDGKFDCSDESDERECREVTGSSTSAPGDDNLDAHRDNDTSDSDFVDNISADSEPFHCPVDTFMCRNGECIPNEQKCDNNIDCSDASDERNCHEVTRTTPSLHASDEKSNCDFNDELTCGDGTCVPVEWICDNVPDCPTGEDEERCHYIQDCPVDTFMCRNGECIPKDRKCDNTVDCSDESDELSCDKVNQTATPSTHASGDVSDVVVVDDELRLRILLTVMLLVLLLIIKFSVTFLSMNNHF